jgi:hypothetical protein
MHALPSFGALTLPSPFRQRERVLTSSINKWNPIIPITFIKVLFYNFQSNSIRLKFLHMNFQLNIESPLTELLKTIKIELIGS